MAEPEKINHIEETLLAVDQLINASIFRGYSGESISARAFREENKSRFWSILKQVIDIGALIFFFTKHHCSKAFIREQRRMHLPPIYRTYKTSTN